MKKTRSLIVQVDTFSKKPHSTLSGTAVKVESGQRVPYAVNLNVVDDAEQDDFDAISNEAPETISTTNGTKAEFITALKNAAEKAISDAEENGGLGGDYTVVMAESKPTDKDWIPIDTRVYAHFKESGNIAWSTRTVMGADEYLPFCFHITY